MADKKISQLTAASTPLAGTEVLPIVQSSATVKVATDDLTVKNFRSNATTGILQVAGPGAGTTRVMTVPNANFTAARTDAAQTFSGLQTFGSGVSITSGKVTSVYGAGGDFVALFQNTTSATPYGVWIKDAATPTAGYPLLNISNDAGTTTYFRVDSSNGDAKIGIGNLIQGTAAKGVNFTANTAAAGMTSQLLNWYEEGTWTPNQGAGLTVVGAFSSSGTYTRIGRQITVRGQVAGATSVAVNAAATITSNLPYSAATTHAGSMFNAAVNASGVVQVTSSSVVAATTIAATANITFTATYQV